MNAACLLLMIVGVERILIAISLRPESVALYAWWLNRRINNDIISLIVTFHLKSFIVDMPCMQRVEVDNRDRKTYQKLKNGQGNQVP